MFKCPGGKFAGKVRCSWNLFGDMYSFECCYELINLRVKIRGPCQGPELSTMHWKPPSKSSFKFKVHPIFLSYGNGLPTRTPLFLSHLLHHNTDHYWPIISYRNFYSCATSKTYAMHYYKDSMELVMFFWTLK